MPQVLYFGDTSLPTAAAYLAGLLTHWGWSYAYTPSDAPPSSAVLAERPALMVLSDYPAGRLTDEMHERLCAWVADGAGLLMCGGWESFRGSAGFWPGTPIGEILPVEMEQTDDRMNCDQPVFVVCRDEQHPITAGLPWRERPPLIGGFNRLQAKPDAAVLLAAARYRAKAAAGQITLELEDRRPLLVVGEHGAGHTAALATDLAPHWVGPLVDWGAARVQAAAAPGCEIEVGALYAQFLRQLLSWTGKLP